MRFNFILFIYVLTIVTVVYSLQDPLVEEWESFKTTYSKQYETQSDEALRIQIFESNLKKIASHNQLYEKGLVTYKMGINHFADLTTEEFLDLNQLKVNQTTSKSPNHLPYKPAENLTLPGEVDWRYEGAITAVKNQGSCGSCWSFSATGALEAQYFFKTGQLVSLSEQYLVDCTVYYGNQGCGGGWMDTAFNFVMDYGIYSEDAYPYEGVDDACRDVDEPKVLTVKDYYDITPGSEDELQAAVASEGPVSVALDASNWQFYSEGIYYDAACTTSYLNHGVLVVGYGTDNADYWLIKNSWGAGWGENGYLRLYRNYYNHCGVASAASYPNV